MSSEHLVNSFGSMPLVELSPALLDQWRTKRLKDNLTIETVNRDIATLKAAISKAVLWGYLEKHPLEKLKLLRTDRKAKIRYLTEQEEISLREALLKREHRIRHERDQFNYWRNERGYSLYPDKPIPSK